MSNTDDLYEVERVLSLLSEGNINLALRFIQSAMKSGAETLLACSRFAAPTETFTNDLSLFALFDLSLSQEMPAWLGMTSSKVSPNSKRRRGK